MLEASRMATKKPGKRKPVLKDATRASDDALRAELRNFDIRKLDKALTKAVRPTPARAR
jgi:hypothetical protein